MTNGRSRQALQRLLTAFVVAARHSHDPVPDSGTAAKWVHPAGRYCFAFALGPGGGLLPTPLFGATPGTADLR